MKRKICILTTILFISLSIIIPVHVYASGLGLSGLTGAFNALYEAVQSEGEVSQTLIENYVKRGFDVSGFLIDESGVLYQKIKDILKNQSGSGISDGSTPEDLAQFFIDNTTVSGNNVTFDDSINTFIKSYSNDYINNNSIRLVYSYDIKYTGGVSNMGAGYPELCSLLEQKQDTYYCVWYNNRVVFFPKENVVCYHHTTNTNTAEFVVYSDNQKTPITWQANDNYTWNGTNWVASNAITGQIGSYVTFEYNTSPSTGMSTSFQYLITYDRIESLLFYPSVNDVGSNDNLSPYYYNREVWQDFSTSTGDYTFTPTNINTVTYGDVTEYIDNSYTDNSYYPDMSQVNNWIENTNTENITNGGGSGSDDDNGGSGSDDDDESILGNLGKVIGQLLKGIINFITGILEGLVDGLTSLLESLTTLISDLIESIPNVISPLLGWIFDGLPDEVQALILLGIGLGITISVIKIIRG